MNGPIRLATTIAGLMLLGGALPSSELRAQEASTLQQDPLFATLFTPELIMQHRRAIDLSDEQRDAISRLISDLQGEVLSLQWELLDEVEQLGSVTGRPRVELDRALDEMGDVLDKEKDIKLAHLEMLIRIKNILSEQQQAQLLELRGSEPSEG